VACNDGDLLQHLQHMGREVVGIDPAHGPVAAAREKGLLVVRDFFTGEVAAEIRDAQGPVDLIVARNVVAHVADLADLFGAFAHLLVPGGVLLVEFQYVADLLAGTQLDHLYHEHRYFHSVTGLAGVAARHGLTLTQVEHVDAQGGSIRAEFRRVAEASKTTAHHWRFLEEMAGLFEPATYEAFAFRALYARERFNYLLNRSGDKLAGLGATAKSCTLLHWLEIGPEWVGFIEDPAPSKIGRFTPGTKIPIVAPETMERPPVMLLLAWNYLAGVLRRERVWMAHGGRLLVPLPLPVVL
jgi:SAM-dependent methyltransferase